MFLSPSEHEDEIVTLDMKDVEFEPASSVDPFGRVFWHQGNVYRTVAEPYIGFVKEILPHFSRWSEIGLVATQRARLRLHDSCFILTHQRVRFRSYCTEWLPSMLRDAAATYLRLQAQLVREGYVLKDGHPWNLLFRAGQPVYTDVGSITRYERQLLERALDEFRKYFLLPLKLFDVWEIDKTYRFLNRSIPNREERDAVAREVRIRDGFFARWLGPEYELNRLARYTDQLGRRVQHATEWTSYEQKSPDISDPGSFVNKQKSVYEILRRIGAGSVLDIGCNKGWYSILAESMGFDIVAVDIDVPSLQALYDQIQAERRSVLPLRIDICEPTPANGIGGTYPGFMDRIQCDVVLAMALVHHLAYKRNFSFELFADRIAKLAKVVAIVEFIPQEDQHLSRWDHRGMEWYRRERFCSAFMRHFRSMQALPSTPVEREVFVFEK